MLGPIMLDIQGTALNAEEKKRLKHPLVGGVILFARNYSSPKQLSLLIKDIKALRKPTLLVAVDQEGGRIQRFCGNGIPELPAMKALGQLYDRRPRQAATTANACGWLMAAQLRCLGVDFSFAPVLDLDKGISQVIGDRAFHAQPEIVIELGKSFISGMHQAGMAAVGKHFPGHGSVKEDSHKRLPTDKRDFEVIVREDLMPFAHLIKAGLPGIMPAHIIYSKADKEPAGFSEFWLEKVLRKHLKFDGAIFSDDLSMQATKNFGSLAERADTALHAGCDMVLICNQSETIDKVLGEVKWKTTKISAIRLDKMRGQEGKIKPNWRKLQSNDDYRQKLYIVHNIKQALK